MARSLTIPDLAFLGRHPLLKRMLPPLGALLAFLLFFLWTFPYDTIARRIEFEARSNGIELTIGSMGSAGLVGLRARDVRMRFAAAPGTEATPELRFDRADLTPDLFQLLLRRTSFGFALEGYGGNASGHAALSNDPRAPGLRSLRLDARDVDLHALPLRDLTGLDFGGKVQLKIDLPELQPADAANGSLTLAVDGATVNGGNLAGFPAPRTGLGHIDGNIGVEKGVATLQRTTARGGDVEGDVDGTIRLRPLLSLSQGDMHVRLRLTDRWLNENQMIRSALGLIQQARQPDGTYLFTFSGPLAHMSPRPGR